MNLFFKATVIGLAITYSYSIASGATAEPGFDPLFDGRTFQGWSDGPDRFTIEDSALLSKPGSRGCMLTEREYRDFILRFEFQLTAGANNGLGIRVPKGGDGSYDGIELQILDDTADKYRDLESYQFHGSAYGIAPAKRGALRPVGDWNEQEVRCQGKRISVILNGTTILDVDLSEAAPGGKTVDGVPHPGLTRTAGHIGFLCHDDVVAFRNVRIRELPAGQEAHMLGE